MLERLVARNFEAINHKDLATHMRRWADDAVFVFPGRSSISGRFVGKAAIEAWWRHWFDRMEQVHFTVRRVAFANPIALDIANTIFIEWAADVITKDGVSAHADAVTVMQVRRRKVVFARDYFFDPTVEEAVFGAA